MNKLEMKTTDIVNENIKYIQERFPNAIVETEKGFEVDFNTLKQEMSNIIADDTKEKYQLTWPGKKEAILLANTRITKTLRPIKEKSVDFDNTENIYIEGDNLEALKILQESYLNKIKCIYIDPPYNTGNDFIYNDNFNKNTNEELEDSGQVDEEGNRLVTNTESNGRFHSDWLSMMYSRLKLARNLLTENGAIFISIDDNEVENLRKLCDEIFGESNQILTAVVNRTSEVATSNVVYKHEYMLIYSKNITRFNVNGIQKYTVSRGTVGNENQSMPIIEFPSGIKCENIEDGIYTETRKINGSLENVENTNPIIVKNGKLLNPVCLKARWRSSNDMRNFFNNNCKPTKAKINGYIFEIYFNNERFNPQIKKLTYQKLDSVFLENKRGSKELENLNLKGSFDYPKSTTLINHFINMILPKLEKQDIILDFFSGSATTAHAVIQLNAEDGGKRKFIMIQVPEKCNENSEAYKDGFETICDIGEERIRRAGKKIKEETNANIDYGFRVYKVDSSNMKDVYYKPNDLEQAQLNLFENNVKEDRTNEDLLTQIILDLGFTLDLKIEEKNILNNKVYYVAENYLVACFDKNIDINIVDEICKCKPLKIVFKEECFNTDNLKINVQEKIKKLSPESKVYVL